MIYPGKAIYLQMADRVCDDIIAGRYTADGRIPSVRELAVRLEVNINTAVKAYEYLARENIIYIKRGMGYYVAPGARDQIIRQRREAFLGQTLPELFRQMRMMRVGIDEVVYAWTHSPDGGKSSAEEPFSGKS